MRWLTLTSRCHGRCSHVLVALGLLALWMPRSNGAPDSRWRQHDMNRPPPPVVQPAPPGQPPSDAILLFKGTDLAQWTALDGSAPKWMLQDGFMESVKGSGYVRTLQNFGDCQLHLEWAAPSRVEGEGQGRGNSGVFLMGRYEVQVLDSWHNPTYADGSVASVYGQYPPLVLALKPPGEWQSFDLVFRRPRFTAKGELTQPAFLTVFHNGVLVHNHVELSGPTDWMNRPPYQAHADKLPLALQDHGNPVRYRNIWVRDLEADGRKEYSYGPHVLDPLTGQYEVRPDFTIAIERQDNQLLARIKTPRRESPHLMFAESPARFFMKTVDAAISFERDGNDRATALTLHIGGENHRATRSKQ